MSDRDGVGLTVKVKLTLSVRWFVTLRGGVGQGRRLAGGWRGATLACRLVLSSTLRKATTRRALEPLGSSTYSARRQERHSSSPRRLTRYIQGPHEHETARSLTNWRPYNSRVAVHVFVNSTNVCALLCRPCEPGRECFGTRKRGLPQTLLIVHHQSARPLTYYSYTRFKSKTKIPVSLRSLEERRSMLNTRQPSHTARQSIA